MCWHARAFVAHVSLIGGWNDVVVFYERNTWQGERSNQIYVPQSKMKKESIE